MGSDAVLVRAIATDNLVSRNGARIPRSELAALAGYLMGKPAIKDHRMYAVDSSWGRIVETAVEALTPPDDLDEHDQLVVKAEGYWVVTCAIAVQPGHPILEELAYGNKGELSITFLYEQMRCPGCVCGEAIWSEKCVNDFWDLPYYERFGVCDGFEISLVVVPAVKEARVLVDK